MRETLPVLYLSIFLPSSPLPVHSFPSVPFLLLEVGHLKFDLINVFTIL